MKRFFIFFTVLICLGIYSPAYAYIDPGTGSMLFSVVLGASAALFYVFSSLILRFKMLLFSKKDLSKNVIPFVIYSEGKQYYSVFKPVLDAFEAREVPVVFYTSAEDDEVFGEDYKFIKPEFIGKGNKAYLRLAFLKADVCLMTTPQLDVLQLKRSKFVKHYAHILHSITFSVDYRLFALDYYDSVLCDARFQIPLIRELECKRNLAAKELRVVGSTYMDYLASGLTGGGGGRLSRNYKDFNDNEQQEITVLVAPTWGPDGLFRKFGKNILMQLAQSGFHVIVRPHPQSMIVEKSLIEGLMREFSQCADMQWDFSPNNLDTLAKADILISDLSCVMFDYAFLFCRPFIFACSDMNKEIYDFGDLDEIPWRFRLMHEIGKELTKDNSENLLTLIKEITDNGNEYRVAIERARDYAWEERGKSAKNVVDFLIEKQREVS